MRLDQAPQVSGWYCEVCTEPRDPGNQSGQVDTSPAPGHSGQQRQGGSGDRARAKFKLFQRPNVREGSVVFQHLFPLYGGN